MSGGRGFGAEPPDGTPREVPGYPAFPYRVAADGGRGGRPPRPIRHVVWERVLRYATAQDVVAVGLSAFPRQVIPAATEAFQLAAADGFGGCRTQHRSRLSAGVMLAAQDPSDMAARSTRIGEPSRSATVRRR